MSRFRIGQLIQDRTAAWFLSILVVCALFIVTTFLFSAGRAMPSVLISKSHFHLGYENNLATWFSGMIFFVAALHAFDGYFVNTGGKRGSASIAWWVMAGLLAVLSLDEIGSIHERLDNNIAPFMYESLPLYPFVITFATLFAGAIFLLWRYREFRWNIGLLLAGFAILATVPFQEKLEHTLEWDHSQLVAGLRVAVEEGSELIGALFLLAASIPNTRALMQGIPGKSREWFLVTTVWRKNVSIVSLCLLIPLVTLFSANINEETVRGYPASWFAAVFFYVAGVNRVKALVCRNYRSSYIDWIFVAYCGLGSAGFVMIPPHQRTEFLFDLDLSRRMFFLGFLVLAFGTIRLISQRRIGTLWWILQAGLIFLIVASVQSTESTMAFLLPCLFSLFVYYDESPDSVN